MLFPDQFAEHPPLKKLNDGMNGRAEIAANGKKRSEMGTKGGEEANQTEKRGLAFGIGTEGGEERVGEVIGVLESVEGVNGEGTNGLIDRARRGVEGKGREENGGSGREGFQ